MIFDRKIKFDVAICLNGEIFNDDIEYIQNANIPIIACDGAANKIFPVIPNYIIGDMDSIDSNIISSRTTIITDKNQDKFDFEKAIDFAINQKFLKVVVLGSNGGVLEHTLNNLSILQRYAFSKNIFLSPLTNNRIGFFIENDVTFQSFKSEIVSIIPISKVKITSSGLKWEFNNSEIIFGKDHTARNQSISNQITIQLHSGNYFLFLDAIIMSDKKVF